MGGSLRSRVRPTTVLSQIKRQRLIYDILIAAGNVRSNLILTTSLSVLLPHVLPPSQTIQSTRVNTISTTIFEYTHLLLLLAIAGTYL